MKDISAGSLSLDLGVSNVQLDSGEVARKTFTVAENVTWNVIAPSAEELALVCGGRPGIGGRTILLVPVAPLKCPPVMERFVPPTTARAANPELVMELSLFASTAKSPNPLVTDRNHSGYCAAAKQNVTHPSG